MRVIGENQPLLFETATVATPLGPVRVIAHAGALVGLDFVEGPRVDALMRDLERRFGPFLTQAAHDPAGVTSRLEAYFAGEVDALVGQILDARGTPFQEAVWKALLEIPAGTALSYATLAARVGSPRAVRAAGAANGANPISLFIPCHRVIASDGTLGGYGGGLERKRWLLDHEGARTSRSSGDPDRVASTATQEFLRLG